VNGRELDGDGQVNATAHDGYNMVYVFVVYSMRSRLRKVLDLRLRRMYVSTACSWYGFIHAAF